MLARLHDTSTGLAIGIGLLKGAADPVDAKFDLARTRQVLEDSLAQLRRLTASLAVGPRVAARAPAVADSLATEASRLGISLQLEVRGSDAWLAPRQVELLELAGREALRNASRHSGARHCRIDLDLEGCPFSMRIRDWGSGLERGSDGHHGLGFIRQLAIEAGCTFSIASQPELGTEFVVTGPACPRQRVAEHR